MAWPERKLHPYLPVTHVMFNLHSLSSHVIEHVGDGFFLLPILGVALSNLHAWKHVTACGLWRELHEIDLIQFFYLLDVLVAICIFCNHTLVPRFTYKKRKTIIYMLVF